MEEFITAWGLESGSNFLKYFLVAGIASLLFYGFLKKKLASRKIQLPFPKLRDYKREVFFSLITTCIFGFYILLVEHYFFEYTNLFEVKRKFGLAYNIFSFFAMIFIHETYFYWTHRLMHHPRLFATFHLVHHKSKNPSPWTSYAFHPLEGIIEGGIIPLIAFTIPVWNELFITFLLFSLIINVYGHSGYELFPKKYNKRYIGRWIGTSVAHNMHHKYNKGNYGLYFLIWDRIMGTIHEKYDQTFYETTERK